MKGFKHENMLLKYGLLWTKSTFLNCAVQPKIALVQCTVKSHPQNQVCGMQYLVNLMVRVSICGRQIGCNVDCECWFGQSVCTNTICQYSTKSHQSAHFSYAYSSYLLHPWLTKPRGKLPRSYQLFPYQE